MRNLMRLGGAFVLAWAGFTPQAHALSCTSTPPPVCEAKPNDIASVRGIDGTAVPGARTCLGGSNPGAICTTNSDCTGGGTCPVITVNVATLAGGSSNLTLTTGGGPSLQTFRVVQTSPGLDATGVVVITDNASPTPRSCSVPVSFRVRAAGSPVNEEICAMTSLAAPNENYSLFIVSAGAGTYPSGTTACSSHIIRCADGPPPNGTDFPPQSRVLTVKSPISSSGATVLMEAVKAGTYDPYLRMIFSRSTDGGTVYSSFVDITSSVVSGSTKIRGTGQWSDVRVVVGQDIDFPAMSEWAVLLLVGLMLLALIWFARRRAAGPA